MVSGSTEVLPKRRPAARVVRRHRVIGRQQQCEHVYESADTRRPNSYSGHQRDANGQLTVCHKKRDRCGVGQYERAQYGDHKRIRAVLEKSIDPKLKSATKGELCTEHLVLRKDQKEEAHGNTKPCQS